MIRSDELFPVNTIASQFLKRIQEKMKGEFCLIQNFVDALSPMEVTVNLFGCDAVSLG
jgi:hypothetical protein